MNGSVVMNCIVVRDEKTRLRAYGIVTLVFDYVNSRGVWKKDNGGAGDGWAWCRGDGGDISDGGGDDWGDGVKDRRRVLNVREIARIASEIGNML